MHISLLKVFVIAISDCADCINSVNSVCSFVCVCACLCDHTGMCIHAYMSESEDNFRESVLSFHHELQVIGLTTARTLSC